MIDSHCHLNCEPLKDTLDDIINLSKNEYVSHFLCVGWDFESSKLAIEIAEKYDFVFAAVGIHPSDCLKFDLNEIDKIESLLNNEKVVAVGEIGLDYYWNKEETEKQKQKLFFVKQIELANKYNLPIIVHSRDAIQDTYDILKTDKSNNSGVIHCYSGSPEMLNNFLDLGYYFGFGGTTTYKNSVAPKESVKVCPLDKLLLETDCPYLSPVPKRGTTNYPGNLNYIIDCIAELKGLSKERIEEETNANFAKLFHVKTL